MPRTMRGLEDNQIYHCLNRGNSRRIVFRNSSDYSSFLQLVKDSKERFLIDIFAYCLMPNHFHFVVRPRKADHLSKWMHWIMTTHNCRHRKIYHSVGHIWQGRYKNFLIQQDRHFIIALRYVERNPVRSNLVKSAEEWHWSSFRDRTLKSEHRIIDDSPVYLGEDWRELVNTPLTAKELAKIRNSVNRQAPFGEKKWQRKISKIHGLEYTLKPLGRPKRKGILLAD